MNIQKLMKQAQQMQEKLLEEQSALELEVGVGGGMVTIKMNGLKQLLEVRIDPEVLDPEDPAMLADLIRAAVNEAGGREISIETISIIKFPPPYLCTPIILLSPLPFC